MELTIDHDIITHSGLVKFNSGQKVQIREIMKRDGYYGKSSGTWYPEKITGVKLVGVYGIWLPQCFKETINK